jgi:hypothetical protein
MSTSETRNLEPAKAKHVKTRLFSAFALALTMGGLAWVGENAYRIATDSFVAPIVLTPDSDLVIQSKLSLGQLVAERIRVQARRDQIDATVTAADEAIDELRALRRESEKALEWSKTISARQISVGALDLRALERQQSVTTHMIAQQRERLLQMKKDVQAGLVARADFEREEQALGQLEVSQIDRERSRLATELATAQAVLANQAMRGAAPDKLSTPEMLVQRDQLVRIQCDIVKLEAERRAALTERGHIEEELGKLDELVGQLKSRPVFRATESDTNVAFIPYTQLDGVRAGAPVMDCVWGVFACKPVGKLSDVLPGEVIVPDPWGTPTRGQYAILDLTDLHAAQSRVLRVRPSGAPKSKPVPGALPNKLAHR